MPEEVTVVEPDAGGQAAGARRLQSNALAAACLSFTFGDMKIVDACRISGRGHAIITDETFTPSGLAHARTRRKIRVVGDEHVVELEITDAEAVLKTGGREFLGFLVPFIDDETVREFIVNRDIELV